MNNYLKIAKAEINNFKGIRHMEVDIAGKSFYVLGKNGASKSSFIQALQSPLNAKFVPGEPITDDEVRGNVSLELEGNIGGEDKKYTLEILFTPSNKKGKISVRDENDVVLGSSRQLVQDIVGNISFDVFEFINMGLTRTGKVSKEGVREQIETLKSFLSIEDQKKLLSLSEEAINKYNERTEINSSVKNMVVQFADDIARYTDAKEKDLLEEDEIVEKLNEVTAQHGELFKDIFDETIQSLVDLRYEIRKSEENIQHHEEYLVPKEHQQELKDFRNHINGMEYETLKSRATDLFAIIVKDHKEASLNIKKEKEKIEFIDRIIPLVEQIENIDRKNKEIEEENKAIRRVAQYYELKKKSENITERLAEIEKEKKKIFSEGSFPVKGLSFSEEEVLYKGKPFNENQFSKAEIISVGLTLAMAMNPNLRLLTITDGSLIDKNTMKAILKEVDEKGYQVIIEAVDPDGEKDLEVEFIEKKI